MHPKQIVEKGFGWIYFCTILMFVGAFVTKNPVDIRYWNTWDKLEWMSPMYLLAALFVLCFIRLPMLSMEADQEAKNRFTDD